MGSSNQLLIKSRSLGVSGMYFLLFSPVNKKLNTLKNKFLGYISKLRSESIVNSIALRCKDNIIFGRSTTYIAEPAEPWGLGGAHAAPFRLWTTKEILKFTQINSEKATKV